jgi:adenylate cyclase
VAKLIDSIARCGPRVIGINILFPEPSDAENDSALTASLEKTGSVVLAYLESHHLVPFNYQREAPPGNHFEIGFLDKVHDRTGKVIGIRPCVRARERAEKAFAVRLAEKYDAQLTRNICNTDLLRINFYGPPNSFPIYSATAVLGGLLSGELHDKIVILCSNVIPLGQNTPIGILSGSEIDATIVQNIVDRTWLRLNKPLAAIIYLLSIVSFAVIFYSRRKLLLLLAAPMCLIAFHTMLIWGILVPASGFLLIFVVNYMLSAVLRRRP